MQYLYSLKGSPKIVLRKCLDYKAALAPSSAMKIKIILFHAAKVHVGAMHLHVHVIDSKKQQDRIERTEFI